MPGIEFLLDALTPFNLLLAVAGVVAGRLCCPSTQGHSQNEQG